MFDFRYHALSLVAVFLALMVGLLLGVAIGDRGLVSSAEKNVRASLSADVRSARAKAAELRRELAQEKRVEQAMYPLLVDGRLAGQRIGLVGLGGLPDATIRAVRDGLKDSGARVTAVAVIREPVAGLPPPAATAATSTNGASPPDPGALRRFGAQVGNDLVHGGKLVRRVQRSLLESSSGQLTGITAVVLFRGAREENRPEAAGTRAFELGLVDGLTLGTARVIGVESTTVDASQIPWFNDRRLASVDNVDQVAGQAALVFALDGANGAYGSKDTAQALLPNTAAGPRR